MLYARASAGSRFGQWFMVAPPLTISEAEKMKVTYVFGFQIADAAIVPRAHVLSYGIS